MIKKIFYALSFVLFSTACNQNDLQEQIPLTDEVQEICATIKEFEFEKSDFSRTSITIEEDGPHYAWAETDTIGIFPNVGRQVEFSMAEGAGSTSAKFTGGGWGLKSTSTYAAYFPLIGQYYLDKTQIPIDYTGQIQNGNNSTAHLGTYDYLAAPASKVNNGTVSFNFERLGCLVQLKIKVPETGTTLNSITLSTASECFTTKGYVDISKESPVIKLKEGISVFTLPLKNITTSEDSETIYIYMMLAPIDLTESGLTADICFDTQSSSNKHQKFSLPSKKLEAGKAYSFPIEMHSLYYRTVKMEEAGTLSTILGEDAATIQTLKISGPINGDDIRLLRHMAGVNLQNENFASQLTILDLSEARIVEGGNYYATMEKWSVGGELGDDYYFYTKNNVFGPFMFSYSNLAEIRLPSTITEIGNLALFDCNSLTKLTIPETVKTMGIAALMHCDNITEVILPYNLQVMRESIFRACKSLKEIPIWPSNITEIPFATFAACYSFVDISIPNNIKKIGDYAFWDCTGMQRIDIPASVTSIGNGIFAGCKSLKKLVCYPTAPPTLGSDVFSSTPKLYVPYDSRDLYQYANGWYNYYKNLYIYAIEWGI